MSSSRSGEKQAPPTATEHDTLPKRSTEKAEIIPDSSSSADVPLPSASMSSRWSTASSTNRQLPPTDSSKRDLRPSDVVASATYIERGQRWMEREEVGSLRQAMDHMGLESHRTTRDSGEDEDRIYNAALDEASELVWQHRNGKAQEPNPHTPYRYKPHMRKNSYQHARAASLGRHAGDAAATALTEGSAGQGSALVSEDSQGHSQRSRHSFNNNRDQDHWSFSHSKNDSRGDIHGGATTSGTRRANVKRNISGEVRQSFSGDQIWEEPEMRFETSFSGNVARNAATPLSDVPKNPRYHDNGVVDKPEGRVAPWTRSTVDIHRNPPSQSRNPQYTTNVSSPRTNSEDNVPKKNGMEIRGNDIRDATTMRLKDRSERLPLPSAVSNNPGRPIVSFDANWNPPEEAADQGSGSTPIGTSGRETRRENQRTMDIPAIVVAGEDDEVEEKSRQSAVPSIVVEESSEPTPAVPSIPMIITPDDDQATNDTTSHPRPLPVPGSTSARRAPVGRPRGHWSPASGASSHAGTSCHECGYPIEGRFVALAGGSERFHPRCFSCYACGTGLEALEISPEPEAARNERLGRIRRRALGEMLEETPGKSAVDDGDERLRFYCHLDWHELFAPKCKHCKTPILGEHVVALGEHWHYGHFFCAECGDPFEQGMTHIEKDGYAWCINCQTKRTERRAPKCKMCGLAVIGQYLQALGGEWHETCFRCAHCSGGFEDGQVFPKEEGGKMIVLCTGCRMRDLKA